MLRVAQAAFAVSEACQIFASARAVFNWLHFPLRNKQPGYNSPHNWLISLAMDLAVLCDMQRRKRHQWMLFAFF